MPVVEITVLWFSATKHQPYESR